MKRAIWTVAVLTWCLTIGALGASAQTSSLPQFGHVVIVVGENAGFGSTYSSSSMPYLTSLANSYGLATNYYADTHPSIGNYFVLTAGQIFSNNDSATPSSLPLSANNIANAVQTAGKTWKDYEESTNGCGALNSGSYYVRHDPLRYYTDVNTESANFVCMSQFATDIANHALPSFSWLTPNGCDDAHDCSLGTFDNWLKTEIAPLLASSYFQPGGDGLLIITFDEDSGSGSTTTTGTTDGGQVETVVISPYSIAGYKSSTRYYHESVLRTMAQGLGASTSNLGAASSTSAMSDFFSTASTATVTLSPTSATLTAAVGSSATQTFTVKNNTTSSVSVTGVAIVPGTLGTEFSQTNTCSSLSASGGSCSITVKFSPTSTGTATATLSVTDSASTTALTAALTGTNTSTSGPAVSLTPASLSFGNQTVGTTSTVQFVTLTNTGNATLNFSGSFTISGPFAFAGQGTCGTSVAAGGSCTISVDFTPTTTGTFTGDVTIADDASNSPQTIPLSGSGVSSSGGSGGSGTTISVSPTSLNFGRIAVGTSSAPEVVTVTNTGGTTVTFTGIQTTGPYSDTTTCASLAVGATCTVSVTFSPTSTGNESGTLTITDNATGSPQVVSLSGHASKH